MTLPETANLVHFDAEWSDAERDHRRREAVSQQVWLLVEIMRPMAVAAGYLAGPAETVTAGETVAEIPLFADPAA